MVVAEFWVFLYALVTVFDDKVSMIHLLGDLEIDDVDVVDGCIAVVIDFVPWCYWWI